MTGDRTIYGSQFLPPDDDAQMAFDFATSHERQVPSCHRGAGGRLDRGRQGGEVGRLPSRGGPLPRRRDRAPLCALRRRAGAARGNWCADRGRSRLPAGGADDGRHGAEHARFVTVGSSGSYYLSDGKVYHCPAFKVSVVDTTGCGDSFHGAFAFALTRGYDIHECVRFSSAVAGLKATKLGGRTGTADVA